MWVYETEGTARRARLSDFDVVGKPSIYPGDREFIEYRKNFEKGNYFTVRVVDSSEITSAATAGTRVRAIIRLRRKKGLKH